MVAIKIWLTLMAGRSEKTALAVAINPESGDWPAGESPRERLMAKLDALNTNLNGRCDAERALALDPKNPASVRQPNP